MPRVVDEDNLRNASKVLRSVRTIQQGSYSQIKPRVKDFFYVDPPYHRNHSRYTPGGFGESAHEQLAAYCRDIDASGGFFMVSNSDTTFVRRIYKDYNIEEIAASRSVSCKANQRGRVNELLIRNYS